LVAGPKCLLVLRFGASLPTVWLGWGGGVAGPGVRRPIAGGPVPVAGAAGQRRDGRVFLGRSPGGRLVAVKVIRAELAENPDFRTRFAREVAAARR
jgi:hypothetical protein